jgi:hypothetical protein
VIGGWIELRNVEIHHVCFSPNIITMIKSSRMRWAGYVTRMEDTRNSYSIWKARGERGQWRDLDYVEDNIEMDRRYNDVVRVGLIWLRIRVSGGLLRIRQ